jgi:hypothetical protein
LLHPLDPPPPECGVGAEAAVVGDTPRREPVDQISGIVHATHGPQRRRPDRPVRKGTHCFLQQPHGARRSGVHPEVEHHQVDPNRQVIATDGVPVVRPIDRGCLAAPEMADVLGADWRMPPGRERPGGDTEIGRPARIARVVHKAALGSEDHREAGLKARGGRSARGKRRAHPIAPA